LLFPYPHLAVGGATQNPQESSREIIPRQVESPIEVDIPVDRGHCPDKLPFVVRFHLNAQWMGPRRPGLLADFCDKIKRRRDPASISLLVDEPNGGLHGSTGGTVRSHEVREAAIGVERPRVTWVVEEDSAAA
jgi:hypothetical protein